MVPGFPRISWNLVILIYINDLSDGLTSSPKLFLDDTSLFFIARDVNLAGNYLNDDLIQINKCSLQRKINFNPNPSKQTKLNSFFNTVEAL